MSEYLLHNARVILPTEIIHGGVIVRHSRIAQVFAQSDKPAGFGPGDTINIGERYLAPGFIDIHIHGSAGVDVQETDLDGLASLSSFLLSRGVTSYFPTFVPADSDSFNSAVKTINSHLAEGGKGHGARILGLHFEGPFVSKKRCGALHTKHFRMYDGDPRSVDLFAPPGADPAGGPGGAGRLMTIAPEVDGAIALIRELTGRGVRCFIGHSTADPEALDMAAQAGARHITHFPNALEPLHHRKPGAVAWGLVRQDITIDCIADFQHIHPLMMRLMYQTKGASRMSLISDAIKPTGLADGVYEVWGDRIAVTKGRTSLAADQATPIDQRTIAGSVITLDQCVSNMMSLGIPIQQAVHMASLAPARAAGIDSEYGSIEVGKRADLILFEEDLSGIQLAFDPLPSN
jgi:N-acetylglucosamine-6-phosphate deacetylase